MTGSGIGEMYAGGRANDETRMLKGDIAERGGSCRARGRFSAPEVHAEGAEIHPAEIAEPT